MSETTLQTEPSHVLHNPHINGHSTAQLHIASPMKRFDGETSKHYLPTQNGIPSISNKALRDPWKPAPSSWKPLCHPQVTKVTQEIDNYFLQNWKFPSAKQEKKFLDAGFSRVTCFYFPLSRDDRIGPACRLLTVLFLIDDLLEDMSFADGATFNEHLMPICRGDVLPDRSKPVEYIIFDLWEEMRLQDRKLADDVLEPTFTFMRAQTDPVRKAIKEMSEYLEYRERDVGKALLSSLMRFCMDLNLSPSQLSVMSPIERNCARHISIINDIFSWEKEVLSSKTAHHEGGILCSAVKVMADETCLGIESSKRVLWALAREWEFLHEEMVQDMEDSGIDELSRMYMEGLEHQMSGNETWSRATLRYSKIE